MREKGGVGVRAGMGPGVDFFRLNVNLHEIIRKKSSRSIFTRNANALKQVLAVLFAVHRQ